MKSYDTVSLANLRCVRSRRHIHVEGETNEDKVETPRRFRLDGRTIEIAENINRWCGPSYRHLRLS
jgi:hypothetical protein